MKQTFHLPFPPTANTMYRVSTRGRKRIHPSEAYAKWKNEAGQALMLQRPKGMSGPVKIEIALKCADKRRWDVDNRIKPVLDLLVSHLIIEDDDHQIARDTRAFYDPSGEIGAAVTLTPLGAA